MITLYGISNCDKCRAAMQWFRSRSCAIRFHDLRSDGIESSLLKRWQSELGDESLLNKRSQTWRAISVTERTDLDASGIRSLILEYPTVIKRPVVDDGVHVQFGYDETAWKHLFF